MNEPLFDKFDKLIIAIGVIAVILFVWWVI
jgi:hypothetical protein